MLNVKPIFKFIKTKEINLHTYYEVKSREQRKIKSVQQPKVHKMRIQLLCV